MTRNLLLLTSVLAGLAMAPVGAAAQGETRTHTVKAGDTLWDLARQYLGDPFRWPEIYRRNQSTIQDPNLIYPDQVIVISGDVAASAGTPADPAAPAETRTDSMVVMDSSGAEVPQQPQGPPPSMTIFNPDRFRVVRGERQSLRIQEAPAAVRLGDFLQAPFMWDGTGVAGAGRVIEGASTDGIGIRNTQRPLQYMEELWFQVPEGAEGAVDQRFLMFRYGPTLEGRGRVVIPTGVVKVTQASQARRARGVVVAKFEDVFPGHLVMALDTLRMEPGVYPARVEFGLATTIAYMYGEPVLPPVGHQIIFAASETDGLVPGDQLTLSIPGTKAADGSQMPPQDVAVAQVTRVTRWGASAIIISQTDGGVRTGMAARVTGKMP
ncbi:LysM peptidoglycan-binding domain-containing protein [Pseudogemmatithrix spongiicola]|uniref:LysM peptidoglycan-binding domain-containing protein n=1 Tax=Pseudogemmatithrix spongiicola TaxID=3062599 RepID=A0AA49K043_9BACT|nr:LysM peptidoglycan-binding domain-containing protein [Gemmatimonadaceae bacterium 'strain 138']WKW15430.1 LysM peptidoglycan-binding domain-containing protein [Gemmatimonadaceae bacterium 'strain 318']